MAGGLRWRLPALALVGGAVAGAFAAMGEEPVPDGLIGWPAETPAVATVPAGPVVAPVRADPGGCRRAREAARRGWTPLATATRRWADEVAETSPGEAARAAEIAALVEGLARGEGDPRALAARLAETSQPPATFAPGFALSEKAVAACTLAAAP
ncbi:MAG: hypothetical protein ACOZNI_36085 [Myxococcota bacterium]